MTTTQDAPTRRYCMCGHAHQTHELRSGGLLGCIIHGCNCIDFAPFGHTCRECGHDERSSWHADTATRLTRQQLCFNCSFWTEYLEKADAPDIARTDDGKHFVIGENRPRDDKTTKGHGGTEFRITFHDGRVVVTDNLWSQGIIPDHFRDRLPVNSEIERTGR